MGWPISPRWRRWPEALARPKPRRRARGAGPRITGSRPSGFAVISEQDILGDRLVRPRRASRRAEHFIAEVTEPDERRPRRACRPRHRPLRRARRPSRPPARRTTVSKSHYAGGDKLFLPVENIELLSRYGSEETEVELDRLGGAGWQTRKARMKSRIREIAAELIKIAAERQLREAPRIAGRPRPLRRVLRRLPLRGDRGPAHRHRGGDRRSRRRPPDGSAGVRRRRLRQDRGGAARRLRRRHERQAGGGGGADHAARATALQDLRRPVPRLPGERRAGIAAGGAGAGRQGRSRGSPTARSTS